jgi:hypothetical protein
MEAENYAYSVGKKEKNKIRWMVGNSLFVIDTAVNHLVHLQHQKPS